MTAEAEPPPLDVTEDRLLEGRVRLRQPRRGHRAGTDAVLLASAAETGPGDHVLDLGSGTGAVGLMMAARAPGIRLGLVEREPLLAELARQNLALNGVGDRVAVHEADLFGDRRAFRDAGLTAGMADVVVTNPPFFATGMRPSPDPGKRSAHVMEGGDLARWVSAAAWMLKPRGRLWLVHRADALGACLMALHPSFGSLVVTPIYPDRGRAAARLIVSAVKGGRAPLRIAMPTYLAEAPLDENAARMSDGGDATT